jgi:polyisoprenoid-binding protein YceI
MATTKWVLDPTHSEVEFKIKHLMISTVTGTFSSFSAEVETEGEDFTTAKTTFTIDVGSLNTKNEQRDGHVKSADFFDAATYPQIKFVVTKIEDVDNDGSYEVYGDLTIHGVTKNINARMRIWRRDQGPLGQHPRRPHHQRKDQPQGIRPRPGAAPPKPAA